jgi:hypothetical protein
MPTHTAKKEDKIKPKNKKGCIAATLRISLRIRLEFFGSPTWTRTRDLRINSPSLYRLSYQGMKRCA